MGRTATLVAERHSPLDARARDFPSWRLLSVRHLWLVVPFVGLAIGSARPIRDNSFLWHVRAGSVQLGLGEVLRTDPFSFTRTGAPWRTQSWLVELGYGLLERLSGELEWVPLMLFAAAALTFSLVGMCAQRATGRVAVTAGLLVGLTWLGLPFLVPRPVLASYLLLALLMVALQSRQLWSLPLIVWVWAAVHGSFVLGLGLLVLWWLRQPTGWRAWAPVVAASMVAATLTAHGVHVWRILLEFGSSGPALALIEEWAPPRLSEASRLPYAAVVTLVLVAAARGRIAVRDVWVVVPFTLFGLTAERALFPAALVLTPWAARAWSPAPHHEGMRAVRPATALFHWVIVLGVAASCLWLVSRPQGLDVDRFPLQAAAAMGPGPSFHDDRVGGYLIYAQWPDRRVFVDDRAELYGLEGFQELIRVRRGGDVWRDVFRREGIYQALLQSDEGLAEELRRQGWRQVIIDGEFVLLSKD